MTKEYFPAWLPLEVARHYGFPVDQYSGRGQSVAVISLGGSLDMDAVKDEFESLDVPVPKIAEKVVEPPPIDPRQGEMGSGEVQMDVQVVGCICPEAKITVYRPEVTGGSSAVAPLRAAFIALVNEARGASGKSRLGFVNERLYALAAEGGLFKDIVSGSNRPANDQPGYDAGEGFDACTGWGTPIGEKLFKALVESP